jgi:hypothetical protein
MVHSFFPGQGQNFRLWNLLIQPLHAGFDVVVSLRRTKSFKWTVNIEHATLEGLKNSILAMYQTPAFENDGAELNMLNDSGKYSLRNDQDIREVLRILVSKNNLRFTVFIETPSKAFSDWTCFQLSLPALRS